MPPNDVTAYSSDVDSIFLAFWDFYCFSLLQYSLCAFLYFTVFGERYVEAAARKENCSKQLVSYHTASSLNNRQYTCSIRLEYSPFSH